jgi:hypothetical protein
MVIAPKEYSILLTWEEAMLYCFSLTIDGATGWRLPNKDELNEIYKLDPHLRNDSYHWASTITNDISVHCQDFEDGTQYDRSAKQWLFYAHPIRD